MSCIYVLNCNRGNNKPSYDDDDDDDDNGSLLCGFNVAIKGLSDPQAHCDQFGVPAIKGLSDPQAHCDQFGVPAIKGLSDPQAHCDQFGVPALVLNKWLALLIYSAMLGCPDLRPEFADESPVVLPHGANPRTRT